MIKLYVVRHGESESNRAGVYSGWGRFLLTEKGFADAAKWFGGYIFLERGNVEAGGMESCEMIGK